MGSFPNTPISPPRAIYRAKTSRYGHSGVISGPSRNPPISPRGAICRPKTSRYRPAEPYTIRKRAYITVWVRNRRFPKPLDIAPPRAIYRSKTSRYGNSGVISGPHRNPPISPRGAMCSPNTSRYRPSRAISAPSRKRTLHFGGDIGACPKSEIARLGPDVAPSIGSTIS
jgi:hypothetical protein